MHADLPVGLPVYYRVSYDSRLFGEQVSESVAFRRVRQLERDAADETKLAAGVTTLPAVNYTTDNVNAHVNRGAISSFDGNAETSCDVYDSQTLGAVETVVGVGLPEAAHVTDVFMYPKSTTVGRLSSAVVLACVSSSAFEAKETHLLAGKQNVTTVDWYRYQPDDSETLYQCLFAYAGPLHDVGIGQFFGNVAEIRFYGWTPSDEAMAVGEPEGVVATPKSLQVRLSWTSAENADSIRVERRAAGEADWTVIATVPASEGRYDDAAVKSRTAYEYRLVSVGLGGRMEAASDAVVATPQGPGLILMVR